MHNNIQLFNYGDNAVRIIERNGEIWFAAKDICGVLDIKNHRDAISVLDDDEKILSEIPTPSNSGYSNMNFISESGFYTLVFRSSKPEAKAFSRWVRHDVLPQIRRTGTYSPEPEKLTKSIMYSAKMVFEAAGIRDNQLALALDKIIAHYTGNSMLALSGVTLHAPTNHQLLTPTLIGKHFGLSGRKVNDLLTNEGFQQKVGKGYEPLELGEPFAVMLDTGKWHSDGSPVRQLKWDSSILDEIEPLLQSV